MSTTSLMTFAEFEQLPSMPGKQELIDGILVAMPPPELAHQEISRRVLLLLLLNLRRTRVWADHTGYRIGGGWVEPDVSVSWPNQTRDDKYFIGAPQLAVEVLAPGETIARKLELYFAEGAQEVWVIDPRRQSLTVYARQGEDVAELEIAGEYGSEVGPVRVRRDDLFHD